MASSLKLNAVERILFFDTNSFENGYDWKFEGGEYEIMQ